MKVRKGQCNLKFNGDGIVSACVDERERFGSSYVMVLVSPQDLLGMEKANDEKRGRPKYIAVICHGEARIYPRPAQTTEIIIRSVTYREE